MADKEIELQIGDRIVGAVIFHESPSTLDLKQTPNGLNLVIPASVELRWNDRSQPCPIMTNLRAMISVEETNGFSVEVGRVWDDNVYFGTTSSKRHTDKAELTWTNILRSLTFIEENRNGRLPKLHFEVRGELFYILKVVGATPPKELRVEPITYDVLSYPHKFYGTVDVTYPQDVWEKMIQAAF